MGKQIKIDFYQVLLPKNCSFSFQELLKQVITQKISAHERNVAFKDHYVRLQEVNEKDNQVFIGNMVRIRMNDIPPVVSLREEKLQDINLESDQGLGEQTFFLYAPKIKILLLHRNFSGVRAGMFARYFETLTGQYPIELLPVLQPDILMKLQKMSIIKRFTVKLARPEHGGFYTTGHPGIKRFIDIINDYEAATIEVRLSNGRQKRSLENGIVFDNIRHFLKIRSEKEEEVEKLIVAGKETLADKTEVLDLLTHRLFDEISVEQENRRLSSMDCQQKLFEVFRKKEGVLNKIFSAGT